MQDLNGKRVVIQIVWIFSCPTDSFQIAKSSSWYEGQQAATVYLA